MGRAAVPCGIVAAILGRAAIFGRALRALLQIDEHDEQHEQDQREHGEQDDQPQQRVDLFGDRPSEDDALREVFALFCRPRIVCRVGQREDDGIGALFIRDQPYLPVFELDARGGIYLHISAVVAENGDGDRFAVIHGCGLAQPFFAQRGRFDERTRHREGADGARVVVVVAPGGDGQLEGARLGRGFARIPEGAVVGVAGIAQRDGAAFGHVDDGLVGLLPVRPAFDGDAQLHFGACDGECRLGAARQIVRGYADLHGQRVAAGLRRRLRVDQAAVRIGNALDILCEEGGGQLELVCRLPVRPALDGDGEIRLGAQHGKVVRRDAAEVVIRLRDGDGEHIFARFRRRLGALVSRARVGRTRVQHAHGAAAEVAAQAIAVRFFAVRPIVDGDREPAGDRLPLDGDGDVHFRRLVVGSLRRVDAHAQPVALGDRRKGVVCIDERRFAVIERRAALDRLLRTRVDVVRAHAARVDDRLRALDDELRILAHDGQRRVARARLHRVGTRLDRRLGRVPRRAVVGGAGVIEVDVRGKHAVQTDERRGDGPAVIDAVFRKDDLQAQRLRQDGVDAVHRAQRVVRSHAAHIDRDDIRADLAALLAGEQDDDEAVRRIAFKHCAARVPGQRGVFAVDDRLVVCRDGDRQRADVQHFGRADQRVVGQRKALVGCADDVEGIAALVDVAELEGAQREHDGVAVHVDKVRADGAELVCAVVGKVIPRPDDRNGLGRDGEIFLPADEHIALGRARDGKGVAARVDKGAVGRDGQRDALVIRVVEVRRDARRLIAAVVDEVCALPNDGRIARLDGDRRRQRKGRCAAIERIVGARRRDGDGDLLAADLGEAFADRVRQADAVRRIQLRRGEQAVGIGHAADAQRQVVLGAVVDGGRVAPIEHARVVGALVDGKFAPIGHCRGEVAVCDDAAHAVVARRPDEIAADGDGRPFFAVKVLILIAERSHVQFVFARRSGRIRFDGHACGGVFAPMHDGELRRGDGDVLRLEREDTPRQPQQRRAVLEAIVAVHGVAQRQRRDIVADIGVFARVQQDEACCIKVLCKLLDAADIRHVVARQRLRVAREVDVGDGEIVTFDRLLLHGEFFRKFGRIGKGVVADRALFHQREHPNGTRVDVRRKLAFRIAAVPQADVVCDLGEFDGRLGAVAQQHGDVAVRVDIRRVICHQLPIHHAVCIGNGDRDIRDRSGRDGDVAVLDVRDLVVGEIDTRKCDGVAADVPRASCLRQGRRDGRPLGLVERLRQVFRSDDRVARAHHDKAIIAVLVRRADGIQVGRIARIDDGLGVLDDDGHRHLFDGVDAARLVDKFLRQHIVVVRICKAGDGEGIPARVDEAVIAIHLDGEVADRAVRLDEVGVYVSAQIFARVGKVVLRRPHDAVDSHGRDGDFRRQLHFRIIVIKTEVGRIRADQLEGGGHRARFIDVRRAARIAGDVHARRRVAQRRALQFAVVLVGIFILFKPVVAEVEGRGGDRPRQLDSSRGGIARFARPAIVVAGDGLEGNGNCVLAHVVGGDVAVCIRRARRDAEGHQLGIETVQLRKLRRERLILAGEIGARVRHIAAARIDCADGRLGERFRRDRPLKRDRIAAACPHEVAAREADDCGVIARIDARIAGEHHRVDRLPVGEFIRRRKAARRVRLRIAVISKFGLVRIRRRGQFARRHGEVRIAECHAVDVVLRGGHEHAQPIAARGEHGQIVHDRIAEVFAIVVGNTFLARRVGKDEGACICRNGRRNGDDRVGQIFFRHAVRPAILRHLDGDHRLRDGKADGAGFCVAIIGIIPIVVIGVDQLEGDPILAQRVRHFYVVALAVRFNIIRLKAVAGVKLYDGRVIPAEAVDGAARRILRKRLDVPIDGHLLLLYGKGILRGVARVVCRIGDADPYVVDACVRRAVKAAGIFVVAACVCEVLDRKRKRYAVVGCFVDELRCDDLGNIAFRDRRGGVCVAVRPAPIVRVGRIPSDFVLLDDDGKTARRIVVVVRFDGVVDGIGARADEGAVAVILLNRKLVRQICARARGGGKVEYIRREGAQRAAVQQHILAARVPDFRRTVDGNDDLACDHLEGARVARAALIVRVAGEGDGVVVIDRRADDKVVADGEAIPAARDRRAVRHIHAERVHVARVVAVGKGAARQGCGETVKRFPHSIRAVSEARLRVDRKGNRALVDGEFCFRAAIRKGIIAVGIDIIHAADGDIEGAARV